MSKEWHDKMHGRGIWHGPPCVFCKAKPQRPSRQEREAILARMNDQAERLGLRQGGSNQALFAEAERILAKPIAKQQIGRKK